MEDIAIVDFVCFVVIPYKCYIEAVTNISVLETVKVIC